VPDFPKASSFVIYLDFCKRSGKPLAPPRVFASSRVPVAVSHIFITRANTPVTMSGNDTRRYSLQAEVEKFRAWALSLPNDKKLTGWEGFYEEWPRLTRAFCDFLDSTPYRTLGENDVALLLYALDKDEDTGVLINELKIRPLHLLALADAGINSVERNARWQLADALAALPNGNQRAELLLEKYFNDQDEYVSRRALIAMGRRASPKTELFAQRAWESGELYKRIAALEVMNTIHSPALSQYLELALQDGRAYLVSAVNKIQSRTEV
jgi:hypothetical protein